jgi:hypothetical protein
MWQCMYIQFSGNGYNNQRTVHWILPHQTNWANLTKGQNALMCKFIVPGVFPHGWMFLEILSAYQEKIPARNAIYAHAQDFAMSDELLLANLKAFIPQPLNKQDNRLHVFSWIQCDSLQNIITTSTVHSKGALTTRYSPLLDVFSLYVAV